MTDLQQRLVESDEVLITASNVIAQELGPNADLFWRFRQAKAKEKAAREESEALRPEICALLDEGELVGIEGAGYLTYQQEERISFDWKAALDAGLFTYEQAEPFIKRSSLQKLMSKRWEDR